MKIDILGVPKSLSNAPGLITPGGDRSPLQNGNVAPPVSTFTTREEAHRLLKELALADGWWALYDPTNAASITLDAQGRLTTIADSLGNGPTLGPMDLGITPAAPQSMGSFTGFTGLFAGNFSERMNFFAQSVTSVSSATIGYLASGAGSDAYAISTTSGVWPQGKDTVVMHRGGQDTHEYVLSSGIVKDGANLVSWGLDAASGDFYSGKLRVEPTKTIDASLEAPKGILHYVEPGTGLSGPLLIARDKPTKGSRDRMQELLVALSGAPASISEDGGLAVEAFASTDTSGKLTAAHRPFKPVQTASVIKALFAYRARKYVTNAMLDQLVAVVDPYRPTDNRFPSVFTGDTISWRDLLTVTNHVSHNRLSSTIAYHVGLMMNAGSTDPIKTFLNTTTTWAKNQGWDEIVLETPNGSANSIMSPLHVAKLFHLIRAEDSWLYTMMGTPSAPFTINHVARGETEAWVETGTVNNLVIDPMGGVNFPELLMGKGGNLVTPITTQTLAVSWRNPTTGQAESMMFSTGPGGNYDSRIGGSRRVMDAARDRNPAPDHWGAEGAGTQARWGRDGSYSYAVLAKDPAYQFWDFTPKLVPFNLAEDPLPIVRAGDVVTFTARVKKPYSGGVGATRQVGIRIRGGEFTTGKEAVVNSAAIDTATASSWTLVTVTGTVRRGGVLTPYLAMEGQNGGAAMWMTTATLGINTPEKETYVFRMDIENFSVTEDSQPLDLSSTAGGVGDFTCSVQRPEFESVVSRYGYRFLQGKNIRLLTNRGDYRGTITDLNLSDAVRVELSGTTAMGPLNAHNVTVPPFNGPLFGLVQSYIGAISESAPEFSMDTELMNIHVTHPGWTGDLWPMMKNLCAAYEMRIESRSDGTIHFGKALHDEFTPSDYSSLQESGNSQTLARAVEVVKYDYRQVYDQTVYPPNGWDPDVEILSVAAGEVAHYDLQLESTLTEISIPQHVEFVDAGSTIGSVFTIVDETGRSITPSAWRAAGGSTSFKLSEDGRSVHVIFAAPERIMLDSWNKKVESYSMGSRFGDAASQYSTLRINGTGVTIRSRTLRIATGVERELTGSEVGVTIDNPFITKMSQVGAAGTRAALTFAGNRSQVSIDGQVIPPPGTLVQGQFQDYRHRSSSISAESVSVDAEYYLRNDEHQQGFTGMTYDQVAAWYEGISFSDAQNRGKKA